MHAAEPSNFARFENYQITCKYACTLFHNISKIVNSFVELVRYLFTLDGVKVFMSQRICQDPLGKFFGCQRQRGATNENPNVS